MTGLERKQQRRATPAYWRKMYGRAIRGQLQARTAEARYRWQLLRVFSDYCAWVADPGANIPQLVAATMAAAIRTHLAKWRFSIRN